MTTPRDVALADLRQSIDMLPERTRRAMLAGLGNNTVITGAFSDGNGVCPMLAAHREGARTRCMSFPEAWDRFTGVHGRYITRQATAGEVLHLRMQLEESLSVPHADTNGFAEAIADHEATVEARRRRSRRESGGFAVDLVGAVEEHRSAARTRREREATEVGLDWLFEETLVLPEDFGLEVEPSEPEVPEEAFDFSREPVVLPAGRRGRSILK
ncbi:MAG: hypothetical protein QOJ35_67 [Solirubrobacteraceae bacterium]|jgi:hypothetical protein|nr:hypothetical protein [Solirubrobacteraceae bacterium]